MPAKDQFMTTMIYAVGAALTMTRVKDFKEMQQYGKQNKKSGTTKFLVFRAVLVCTHEQLIDE